MSSPQVHQYLDGSAEGLGIGFRVVLAEQIAGQEDRANEGGTFPYAQR